MLRRSSRASERGDDVVVLVDTSVWIAEFRKHGVLAAHVAENELAVCPPVIQEVLQGIRFEHLYRAARELLFSVRLFESPMRVDVFEQAAEIYRTGRNMGITTASIDCLIAACAIRNRVTLLHSDRDFDAIARFTPL